MLKREANKLCEPHEQISRKMLNFVAAKSQKLQIDKAVKFVSPKAIQVVIAK